MADATPQRADRIPLANSAATSANFPQIDIARIPRTRSCLKHTDLYADLHKRIASGRPLRPKKLPVISSGDAEPQCRYALFNFLTRLLTRSGHRLMGVSCTKESTYRAVCQPKGPETLLPRPHSSRFFLPFPLGSFSRVRMLSNISITSGTVLLRQIDQHVQSVAFL